ncbi:MAG: DUF4349 domain-containing protein [Bacteroidales bacterium]
MKYVPPVVKSEYNLSADENGADIEESDLTIDVSKINKKKIIKDGDISIKVNNIDNAKLAIDQLLKNNTSYYETEDFQNNDDKISYELKIRIPSDNFEKFMNNIERNEGEITSKNIRARDVTEEFVDLSSRLNNKKIYLKKYNDLLTKAKTVKDIIEIQENIRNLQEELESTEGRLKYLNDQISYSTLNVILFKDKDYTFKPQKHISFIERLKTSINNGWARFVDFTLMIIQNWVLIIVFLVFTLLIRRFIKKRQAKK